MERRACFIAREKNNFFLFLARKIFIYFLGTWDLFLLFPPDSKGEKSVSQTTKVNK